MHHWQSMWLGCRKGTCTKSVYKLAPWYDRESLHTILPVFQVLRMRHWKPMWFDCSPGSCASTIFKITLETQMRVVTDNLARLPSPLKALLAIDEIWLKVMDLNEKTKQSHWWSDSASLYTIESGFQDQWMHHSQSTWSGCSSCPCMSRIYIKNAVMWQCIVTYNWVRLPSPEKAPLAIDVIWLLVRYLHERCENWRRDVTLHRNIQIFQASKSSKCATLNRCDLVVVKIPERSLCERTHRDVAVKHDIQCSQASQSSECAISNRCDLVSVEVPARAM